MSSRKACHPMARPEPERELIEIVRCERCEGILYARDSMKRGMGPGCWHKTHAQSVYQRLEAQGQIRMFTDPGKSEGGLQ